MLLYNSKLADGGSGAPGTITMGGGGAILSLHAICLPVRRSTIDLVIFQDRTVTLTVDD